MLDPGDDASEASDQPGLASEGGPIEVVGVGLLQNLLVVIFQS